MVRGQSNFRTVETFTDLIVIELSGQVGFNIVWIEMKYSRGPAGRLI